MTISIDILAYVYLVCIGTSLLFLLLKILFLYTNEYLQINYCRFCNKKSPDIIRAFIFYYSPLKGRRAMFLALLMLTASSLWCNAHTPV